MFSGAFWYKRLNERRGSNLLDRLFKLSIAELNIPVVNHQLLQILEIAQ